MGERKSPCIPVISVSFNDITKDFIPWLNKKSNKTTSKLYRLPTEAEWEYAARSGSQEKYSWGNNKANCNGCGSQWDKKRVAPVGSFSANKFGLYDMHGNVWEWTQDCWNDSYNGAPNNGSVWKKDNCGHSVLRGGSWVNSPVVLRSSTRIGDGRATRIDSNGFRLIQGL